MINILEQGIIIANDKYLAFPDIIKSQNQDSLFLVYRSSNVHHPISSALHFLRSDDKGKTWEQKFEIQASLMKEGFVWNCPRLTYKPNGCLTLICDTKNHTQESKADFKIVFIDINEEKNTYSPPYLSGIIGMVPDRFVSFKGKLVCAVHTKNTVHKNLIQLAYWSRDEGKTFLDCNIVARVKNYDFCEASLVNYKNNILLAYLRENSSPNNNIYLSWSQDLINWNEPEKLKIQGHRVTAKYIKDTIVFGTFRNTKDMAVSAFKHTPFSQHIETINVIKEKPENLYNFGYTGFCEIKTSVFYIVYYIKQESQQPFIGYSIVNIN